MDCLQDYPYYETDIINDKANTTDLHTYFMTQFNMELENKNKVKTVDNFRYGNEESFDFAVLDNNLSNKHDQGLHIIDQVIENTAVDEESMKDVLLDLDTFEFDKNENSKNTNSKQNMNASSDYIDDEYLLDELCREEYDYRLSPELFPDEYLTNNNTPLPSIDTVFSKRHNNVTTDVLTKSHEEMTFVPFDQTNDLKIQNIDYYSYPNNVIYNLNNNIDYTLPDTPTSCTEFNFDKRTVSVSESIESDVQSCYIDENSENYDDDDELFVNLEDFGIHIEQEDKSNDSTPNTKREKKNNRNEIQGERICLWENCNEKYPSQSTLVEHIERIHVNSYKGDEFSCLWHNCPRSRRPFNARYKLLIHMRVHSGHKPNRCHHPGCGKAFSRLENLKIHVRSHTGERPYKCPAPHCRKAFSNSSDRAKHQRTHFNARPYACGALGCGKRYTDPSSLRKHVKSHPHINVPRTCVPSRTPRRLETEQLVPSSPAKLATLRCIRDKLTVPRMQRI